MAPLMSLLGQSVSTYTSCLLTSSFETDYEQTTRHPRSFRAKHTGAKNKTCGLSVFCSTLSSTKRIRSTISTKLFQGGWLLQFLLWSKMVRHFFSPTANHGKTKLESPVSKNGSSTRRNKQVAWSRRGSRNCLVLARKEFTTDRRMTRNAPNILRDEPPVFDRAPLFPRRANPAR